MTKVLEDEYTLTQFALDLAVLHSAKSHKNVLSICYNKSMKILSFNRKR